MQGWITFPNAEEVPTGAVVRLSQRPKRYTKRLVEWVGTLGVISSVRGSDAYVSFGGEEKTVPVYFTDLEYFRYRSVAEDPSTTTLDDGGIDGVLQTCSRRIEANPRVVDVAVILLRAMVYLCKNMLGEALTDAERVAKASPNNSNSHVLKGILLARLDDVDAAIASFRQALELSPNSWYVRAHFLPVLQNRLSMSSGQDSVSREAIAHLLEDSTTDEERAAIEQLLPASLPLSNSSKLPVSSLPTKGVRAQAPREGGQAPKPSRIPVSTLPQKHEMEGRPRAAPAPRERPAVDYYAERQKRQRGRERAGASLPPSQLPVRARNAGRHEERTHRVEAPPRPAREERRADPRDVRNNRDLPLPRSTLRAADRDRVVSRAAPAAAAQPPASGGMAEVKRVLTKLGLTEYCPVFESQGLDSMRLLSLAEVADYEACGVKRMHALLIRKEASRSS